MLPSKFIFLCFVIHSCSSEKSQKKFPVPRHILTEVETTTKSSSLLQNEDPKRSSNEDLVLKNSTRGLPLISFAEERKISREENDLNDTTAETTVTPESFGLDSNPNFCTQPARCEPLPQNATW